MPTLRTVALRVAVVPSTGTTGSTTSSAAAIAGSATSGSTAAPTRTIISADGGLGSPLPAPATAVNPFSSAGSGTSRSSKRPAGARRVASSPGNRYPLRVQR
ncbi:MAG: hypothetical protein GY856_37680 [bacterium]|nr:hypothetical protein [bacterium]